MGNDMRIAQITPLQVATPPRGYGGTERVISYLTEALVRLGHDVTLFATGDSRTRARLEPQIPKALKFNAEVDASAYHLAALKEVYDRADEFDIIHSHLDYLTMPFAAATRVPTVMTLHGRIDRDEFRRAYEAFGGAKRGATAANFVAISDSQRRFQPHLNWVATIHHGIDVQSFPYYPTPDNYLCFIGRISPEKGPERAIKVAKRAGVPLKIAAKVGPNDRAYFSEVVAPLLDDPLIEFLGELDEVSKRDLMGHARALLLPIDWPEPFGLVYIEALACGTPVLTSPHGSAPELLRDGVTAYFGNTVADLVEAVGRLPSIKRATCRREAQERFDASRMAMEYSSIYAGLSQATLLDRTWPMLTDLADATYSNGRDAH
jgi:glycosyltransferase involved in cell wall biosynthesis